MRIRFLNGKGQPLWGKFVEYKSDTKKTVVYVTDESGARHLELDEKQVLCKIEETEEEVKKPTRYNKTGKLECWDVILDQKMDFLEGSIIKYLWRHKQKNGKHDLKKAAEYLNKMIADYDKIYTKD